MSLHINKNWRKASQELLWREWYLWSSEEVVQACQLFITCVTKERESWRFYIYRPYRGIFSLKRKIFNQLKFNITCHYIELHENNIHRWLNGVSSHFIWRRWAWRAMLQDISAWKTTCSVWISKHNILTLPGRKNSFRRSLSVLSFLSSM